MKKTIATLFIILSIAVPVFAQDVTPEPFPTVEQPPVTIEPTIVATETPVPVQPLFNPATAAELLLFLGLSALAGGGVVAIITSFLGRKDVRDRVEDARNTWSPEQQEMLKRFTDMFESTTDKITDFLKAVQDGQPNS